MELGKICLGYAITSMVFAREMGRHLAVHAFMLQTAVVFLCGGVFAVVIEKAGQA